MRLVVLEYCCRGCKISSIQSQPEIAMYAVLILFYLSHIDSSGKLIPLALVVYKFDGVPEHAVLTRPHGNAKQNKPSRRTRESTKSRLKVELEHNSPKEAVDKVFAERGGCSSSSKCRRAPER